MRKLRVLWTVLGVLGSGCATMAKKPVPESLGHRKVIDLRPAATSSTARAEKTATEAPPPEKGEADDDAVSSALERLARSSSAAEAGVSGVAGEDRIIDPKWLSAEIARAIGAFGKDEGRPVPPGLVREVERCMRWLSRSDQGRAWFGRSLRRMDAYAATVRTIFKARDLPPLLDHLALIESGYEPRARSHAGAAGMWQFMPATARRYGLDVDRNTDDRLDPIKATFAAREYLLDLLLEFGSGHDALLAVAAYNAGEGRIRAVLRQLKSYRDRSFWVLAERGLLPSETKMYVPMILAATILSEHRARFGFAAAEPAPVLAFDGHRQNAAPPAKEKVAAADHGTRQRSPAAAPKPLLRYLVRPHNTVSAIAEAFGVPQSLVHRAAGPRGKLHAGQVLALPIGGWERTSHRVVKGESLERIAKRHGTSVRALCVFNGLTTSRIVTGDLLAIYRRTQAVGVRSRTGRTRES